MSELQHNSYFDGGLQSIGFARNGRRMTVGAMAAGEYHFDTDAPERMTVTSGELFIRMAGKDWRSYPTGVTFEIPGSTGFDVRADESSAYLCEFL